MSEEKKVSSGDQEDKETNPINTPNAEENPVQPDASAEVEASNTEEEAESPAETTEVAATEDVVGAVEATPEAAEPEPEAAVEESVEQETEAVKEEPAAEAEPSVEKEPTSEAVEEDTTEEPVAETPPVAETQTIVDPTEGVIDVPVTAEAPPPAPIAEEAPVEATASPAPEEATAESETPEVTAEAEALVAAVEETSTPAAEEVSSESTDENDAPEAVTTVEASETPVADSTDTAEASAEDEDEDEEEHEVIDYSNHSREELAEVVEELSKQDNFKKADAILNQVEPLFLEKEEAARNEALQKFLADGGEEADFEYRHDDIYNRFDASLKLTRDRRSNFYKEREAQKERNYQKKQELLDHLRELVDGENATTNINPIKEVQDTWKAIGPVPAQHNKTLWANYNALLDRFYSNRHILFELKELDRKKNLVKKEELCEKAEALDKMENIKDAIIQLNELHEEYKRIGPVPREVQEQLWQRFKAASDAIYKKRKEYLDHLKSDLQENLHKKKALADELQPYLNFDSDRINDWNAKTKEILAIQKKWDALGGLPREHAKEVNKAFWSAFKKFFSNKNAFFKKLEGQRQDNLARKEELVTKAEALAESDEWDKTAETLKGLQRQWREIGPVPEKFRNSVYAKFKAACDAFFNNKRASQNKAESQYVENLKHKEDLVAEINKIATEKSGKPEDLDDLLTRWGAIGFVPRGAIKSIEDKFAKAIEAFVSSLGLEGEEGDQLRMKAELNSLKKGPNADRRLNKKEAILRKQIQELEDNIALWNNNLSFFANSKTADKLKAEFDEKIEKAEQEITALKKQLRIVRSM